MFIIWIFFFSILVAESDFRGFHMLTKAKPRKRHEQQSQDKAKEEEEVDDVEKMDEEAHDINDNGKREYIFSLLLFSHRFEFDL